MTVFPRLDAVPESPERTVLDMKTTLHAIGVATQDATLGQAAGQAFHDTSRLTFRNLRARAKGQQLRADSADHPDGFSFNTQNLLESVEFRSPSPR